MTNGPARPQNPFGPGALRPLTARRPVMAPDTESLARRVLNLATVDIEELLSDRIVRDSRKLTCNLERIGCQYGTITVELNNSHGERADKTMSYYGVMVKVHCSGQNNFGPLLASIIEVFRRRFSLDLGSTDEKFIRFMVTSDQP